MPDDLDSKILRMLQKDAKLTYEQIGEALERSPSTIRDRIKRMEEDRIILGYSAIVDATRLGIKADAFVSADIDQSQSGRAVAELMTLKNVSEILHLTGERRVFIRVRAASNQELMEIVDRKIRPLGFSNIEITMVLDTVLRYPGI
jgi:DNA-binding Lrp family transcriptional regulator